MNHKLKGRDFPMKAKVNAACIAVGNGGRNVLNWFAKQEGMAKYHDYLELIAVDTDARKLDLAEGDDGAAKAIRSLVDTVTIEPAASGPPGVIVRGRLGSLLGLDPFQVGSHVGGDAGAG